MHRPLVGALPISPLERPLEAPLQWLFFLNQRCNDGVGKGLAHLAEIGELEVVAALTLAPENNGGDRFPRLESSASIVLKDGFRLD